jgi:hypothetical protein
MYSDSGKTEPSKDLKIFTFTWNTESNRLAESLSVDTVKENRETIFTGYCFNSEIPDFFPALASKIVESEADIVVFAMQEDVSPGNYFHSHFLKEEMPKMGYFLVHRNKMMGVGVTTYKALFNFDIKLRGLRTSVYAKKSLAYQIQENEKNVINTIGYSSNEYPTHPIFRNKGGLASYIMIPSFGLLAIINCHIIFNSKSLLETEVKKDLMIRQSDVQTQNVCFNDIYRSLVLNLPVKPNYVIYLGDFNYRMVTIGKLTTQEITALDLAEAFEKRPSMELFKNCYNFFDELKEQQDKKLIYEFEEGLNNEGPAFIPTGKLSKNREDGYEKAKSASEDGLDMRIGSTVFKTGIMHHRCPSYCDRILYKTLQGEKMQCLMYDRFDEGKAMKLSDHAAVIGLFSIP